MTGYRILRTENLPDSLKNKPKWQLCVIFSTGLLVMTLSAIGAGVFIGYTYCYMAHGTGFKTENASEKFLQYTEAPLHESKEEAYKKTINGALASNVIVQKILKIGHGFWDKDTVFSKSFQDMELDQI